MTSTRSALRLAVLATAFVVAACGGAPTTAPTLATPTGLPLPSLDRETFDLSSFDLGSFAIPSFAGDEELEALLPDSIGGQIVIKQSLAGEAILNSPFGGAAAIEDMLAEVGASIDDVSLAVGAAGASLILLAYHVEGVSAERTFEGLRGALPSAGAGQVSQITVAGRDVMKVVAAGETTYIYLAREVVFIIGGTVTPELLADAVSQLPKA